MFEALELKHEERDQEGYFNEDREPVRDADNTRKWWRLIAGVELVYRLCTSSECNVSEREMMVAPCEDEVEEEGEEGKSTVQ